MFFTLNKKILLFILALTSLACSTVAVADQEESFAYKLAVLYVKNQNPEKVLLEGDIEPAPSIIYEFQWILDSMKNRCINNEETIAATIVEIWHKAQVHKDINILETARTLSLNAKNTVLFGTKKVNFRLTSHYWLVQQIYK